MKLTLLLTLIANLLFGFMLIANHNSDYIPPLPIDELKKIELDYIDTLKISSRDDSLLIQLFAGNVFGISLKHLTPIKARSLLTYQLSAIKDFDYADYFLTDNFLRYGLLAKNFWHEFSFQYNKKLHLINGFGSTHRYYEMLGASCEPVCFFRVGSARLHTRFRKAVYQNIIKSDFYTASSLLSLNLPTRLGIFNYATDALFQVMYRDIQINDFDANFKLDDLITISDNLFCQPAVLYNLNNNLIGAALNLGLRTGQINTYLNLEYNSVRFFYADTVFSQMLPHWTNRINFAPILCNFDIRITLATSGLGFTCGYAQYGSHLNYQVHHDSIIPLIEDSLFRNLYVRFNNRFTIRYPSMIINNIITAQYPIDKIHLMPIINLSDSLSLGWQNYSANLNFNFTGKREWYLESLPAHIVISSGIAYKYRSFVISAQVENIFDSKYVIIPDYKNKGRKYFLSVGVNIN